MASVVPPGPSRPIVGHVGSPCNDSTPCLGEAGCVEGVCRCHGTGWRAVNGVCVYSTTPATKTPRSSRSSPSSRGSSAKTLPSTVRFSLLRTVRLGTTPTNTKAVAASVITEDGVGLNTSEPDGSARNGEDSRGTMAPNVTAQGEEEKAVQKREARAE
nr:uncharacterized protein LOC126522177 [Dermacentor andersoni]